MTPTIIFHGILIGMLISIPTGPVGFLCLRRALLHSRHSSFVSALGSITADLIFGLIGIFSLTSTHDFYVHEQTPIRFVGALILLYVGIKTYFNMTSTAIPGLQKYEHVGNFTSTFLLTMTNPVQIITLPLVFAAIGTGVRSANYGDASFFLAGLGVGAVALWIIFISIASSLKKRILEYHLHYINKFSGALITGTGIYILLSLILR